MPLLANNSRFHFDIPSLEEELHVVGFDHEESLSGLFQCRLELACLRHNLPLNNLLAQAGVLTLYDEQHPRLIHGEVARAALGAIGTRYTTYYLTLRPKLWWLTLRSGMRIFQERSVPEILLQVIQDAGLQVDVSIRTRRPYPPRDYCCQYQETDFAFISRLMEEEGLFYYFEHRLDQHLMVITDQQDSLGMMDGSAELPYHPKSGMVADEVSVYDFNLRHQLYSGAVATRDYDFEKPDLKLHSEAEVGRFAMLQHYHYPGGFQQPAQGAHYAAVHQARQGQSQTVARGQSDCHRLQAGRRFILDKPGNAAGGKPFKLELLLTRLHIHGRQPQVLEEGAGSGGSEFDVRFQAMPSDLLYRPPIQHPKPQADGIQTAFVTGPQGEDIYTDAHGRIKVQFHWDREGKRDENSSGWIRISQGWAGNEWGAFSLPRVGQEVLVSFLDGDPDRPIVTGALYNSQTIPPDKLPAQQTRTTFKSRSSPDGGGHNTLRIDDKKHQEQIYVHAQKDLDYYIRNDKRESIGHQRHRIVQGSAYDHIENNQHRTIGKDHNLQIDGQQSRSIGQSMEQKIGQNYREHAAVEYHLKAGAGVVLDAGQSLTLKAAGSSVVLDETGVSVTGLMVLINSGGGAGSATSAFATPPQQADTVDPGQPGHPIAPLGANARFKNAPVEFDPASFSAIEKPKDITPTQGEGFGADDALSLSLDLITGVGTAKGVVELIAGFDPVTGEEIPRWISTAALAASIIPGGKAAVRGARTAGKMAKHADEAVDVGEAVVKHGDEVGQVAGTKSGADTMHAEVVSEKVPNRATGAFDPDVIKVWPGLGKLEGKQVNISEKGLNMVENHLKHFDVDGPVLENQLMVDRLRTALNDGKPLTGADASFYIHEVTEAAKTTRVTNQLGVPYKTVANDYDLYQTLHWDSINKYEVSPFSVYHPEVINKVNNVTPGEFPHFDS
ncbi:type VI secretion system tip protein VgrG [Ketobacter sp. MCCC 1A13808]|uniref:type VI secretion system Vgr family protein n=1 Tax=Ketobacter sp. MCCC 1A13808 TaxID=2602738 RepID=UPI0012EBE6CE|nr:type VI secretion system tip protein TssI/VgrG [Ketobacter sp. MCCC 1A13808]MVF13681.1 type VI secretion system tip protein VgrG [Ketobacter sp. MCCC 1A13808]